MAKVITTQNQSTDRTKAPEQCDVSTQPAGGQTDPYRSTMVSQCRHPITHEAAREMAERSKTTRWEYDGSPQLLLDYIDQREAIERELAELRERITTIADEAGEGLQPVQSADDSLTHIERMLAKLHREREQARREGYERGKADERREWERKRESERIGRT